MNHSDARPDAGTKDDEGKPRYDLVDPRWLESVVLVLGTGADKYGPDNYKNGLAPERIVAALHRHMAAYEKGQLLDPDSGRYHLSHVAACSMMLYHLAEAQGKAFDRWSDI